MESDLQPVQSTPTLSSDDMPSRPRRRRFGLRNWRVGARLVALIAIPTVVAAPLAAFRVCWGVSDATVYQRVERLADLAAKTNALAHELQTERDRTAAYAATSADPKGRSSSTLGDLRQRQTEVNTAVAAVRTAA